MSVTIPRWISESAPAATLLLLLVLPAILPNQTVSDPAIAVRRAEVAAAMNDIPFTIGTWVGTEIEIPPAAVQLLHPNAIFSRRYERLPNGPVVSVLIVHCSDARDMVGHYPPICYPSSGWSMRGEARRSELRFGRVIAPMRLYEFTRMLEHGRQAGIRIFSFFILPDGTLTSEMDDIYAQSERLAVSVQGAAQVQVITAIDVPEDAAFEASAALLEGMEELFDTFNATKERADGQTR